MTPYSLTQGTLVKNADHWHFSKKSDLKVPKTLVMFLKLMLIIVEVLSNVLVLISQVAALNGSDTIYPNLGHPVKNSENRHFWHEKSYECTLSISDVTESYVDNSWGP